MGELLCACKLSIYRGTFTHLDQRREWMDEWKQPISGRDEKKGDDIGIDSESRTHQVEGDDSQNARLRSLKRTKAWRHFVSSDQKSGVPGTNRWFRYLGMFAKCGKWNSRFWRQELPD